MSNFASNTPEEGKDIGDYELTKYAYNYRSDYGGKKMTIKEKQMIYISNKNYWLASSFVGADFSENYADFGIMSIGAGTVGTLDILYYSDNYPADDCTREIRPLVTLKTGLEIDTSDTTRDGSTAEKAWKIKGN